MPTFAHNIFDNIGVSKLGKNYSTLIDIAFLSKDTQSMRCLSFAAISFLYLEVMPKENRKFKFLAIEEAQTIN